MFQVLKQQLPGDAVALLPVVEPYLFDLVTRQVTGLRQESVGEPDQQSQGRAMRAAGVRAALAWRFCSELRLAPTCRPPQPARSAWSVHNPRCPQELSSVICHRLENRGFTDRSWLSSGL